MTNVVPLRSAQPAEAQPFDREVNEPPPSDDDRPGGPRGPGPGTPTDGPPDFDRVVPLGVTTRKGQTAYVFLDSVGLQVTLSARDLYQRACLCGLFGGQRGAEHLAFHWPVMRPKRDARGKVVRGESEPSGDFDAEAVGNALMDACSAAGYAEAVELRRDGIWPYQAGLIFHAGDAILDGAAEHRPGLRDRQVIYTGCMARPRPAAEPATMAQVAEIAADLALWHYAAPAAPRLLLGLVACGLLGAAIPWRPHVFLRGPRGAGKSTLTHLIAAACGAGEPSTDITAAGLRRLFDARSGLIPLDEREADAQGVQRVVEIMRGSSDGRGSVTIQADPDSGGSKAWRVAGSFLFAAITLPPLTDADVSRITLVQLRKLLVDRRAEAEAAIRRAATLHPALLRRVLDAWPRWQQTWPVARDAAIALDATSRSADQLGALFAGYWLLAEDAPLTPRVAAQEMALIAEFLTTRADALDGEAGYLVLQHLLASRAMVTERSSDQMTIQAALIAQWRAHLGVTAGGGAEAEERVRSWRKRLGASGLRWETGLRAEGWRGDGPPEMGVWIAHTSPAVAALFQGSPWPGAAWREPLRDLPGVQASKGTVAFTHGGNHRATFVPYALLGVTDEDLLDG
jgi:hypothetical protein